MIPKLKFYLIVEYKRPLGVHPLHDFHKIYVVCSLFPGASAIKI